MQFTVSIVTVNRADRLRRVLEALLAQSYNLNDVQFIVADNGSTDETPSLSESYAAKFPEFCYVRDDRPGQLVGWHRALDLAEGDIACFIDDDACPAASWLEALAEVYRDPAVGMATGPIKPDYDVEPPDWFASMTLGEPGHETLPFLGLMEAGTDKRDIPGNFVWGSNFTVRRELLERVGGFHPCAMPWHLIRFYGDGEVSVGQRVENLGKRIIYHPEARVSHIIPEARMTMEAVRAKFITAACARSFRHLREIEKPYELPTDDEIRSIANSYFRDPGSASKEFYDCVWQSLKEGFVMHLTAFREDPDFRAWVLCESFRNLDDCYVHTELQPGANVQSDWRAGGAAEGAT